MAGTAQDGESPAASPGPGRPSRRMGPRATVLAVVAATAILAVTGYAWALAGIDGVTAIGGDASGQRPPPGKGVVAGISSFVRSSAFAAALSSASRQAGNPQASPRTSPRVSPQPSGIANDGRGSPRALVTPDGPECLPAAAACADLTARLPWPDDDDAAGYGPVLP